MRENLVIVTAGENSLHKAWLKFNRRSFDVFTVDYSKEKLLQGIGSEYYLSQPDVKFHSTLDAIENLAEKIHDYKYVFCPDDDLFIHPHDLNRMFKIAWKYDLDMGQPALTRNSYYSFPITLQVPFLEVRLVNLVEIMAPFFKPKALLEVSQKFKSVETGWGLDHYFQKIALERAWKVGIIDRTPVVHTRPVRGSIKNSFDGKLGGFYALTKVKPWEEMREFHLTEAIYPQKGKTISAFIRPWLRVPVISAKWASKIARDKKNRKP